MRPAEEGNISYLLIPGVTVLCSDAAMEEEFIWEEYMEETGADAAPHTTFRHVETSLESSFQPGMKLEVANKSNPETYWVATIITTCGQLLLLRYSGYGDDRKADFWCDVMTAELHPVGWCSQNNKTLMPPEAIKEKYSDWTEFLIQDLTGSRTAPANLLEGPLRGKNTVDLIVDGSVLEVRDASDPLLYWPARVVQNIGGRLRLRHAGLTEEHRARDVWLFYLDVRLRPLGWALENSLTLEPPAELKPLRSDSDWQQALQDARVDGQKNPLPLEVFKDHMDLPKHSFRTGMKLEMVSAWEQLQICPVSVTKVYSEIYFQVTLDDLSADATPRSVVCHANSPGILPVQWCLKNGVVLERPRGYEGQDFDWADYLKQTGTEAAPDACFPDTLQTRGFSKDMWLEAVNPRRPEEVCVAQIARARGRLLWLRLEGVPKPLSECIVDVESMDIFPVGWCEANAYPLTPPVKPVRQKQKKIAVDLFVPSSPGSANGRYCCSKIYVNQRCFSGPYLNKGRIAELPQAVGPGKCTLVLKELLSMLINAAYKPGRVLKELQELEDQSWECQEETLKAKYKGKSYRSTVRIVRLAEQIPDFCRKVCTKLQCCPNLFGPALVTDKCPENCSVQTKTKYTCYYGKKRKLPRAAGGDEAAGAEMAKPPRRRRKRKAIFVQKKRRSSNVDYTPAGSPRVSTAGVPQDPASRSDPLTHLALQSGSEGTSSEPRDDHTDASSAEVTSSSGRRRPRRAATLRRAFSVGFPAVHETPGSRRRSTRSSQRLVLTCFQVEEDGGGLLVLDRNPLEWTVDEVVQFINSTDCASLAKIFREQDIDGQALLLLTLPTVQECMDLKLGPAIKLCHQIERVKVAFYKQFAD
uniref:Scm like with four mbt domains 2 n=1 Tax=Fundulus heteroclitus TaxID=8078 RepID=A0A3Q2QIF9_FUNHE